MPTLRRGPNLVPILEGKDNLGNRVVLIPDGHSSTVAQIVTSEQAPPSGSQSYDSSLPREVGNVKNPRPKAGVLNLSRILFSLEGTIPPERQASQ